MTDNRNNGNHRGRRPHERIGPDARELARLAPRRVRPGQTVADALADEMALRGHNNREAAEAMGISEDNVSRWLSPFNPSIPGSRQSAWDRSVLPIIRYIRLEDDVQYGTLWFNSTQELRRRKGLTP